MKNTIVEFEVPPLVKARMKAKAKECGLDLGLWLSEVMEFLCSDDFRNEEEAFEAAMEVLRSRTPEQAEKELNRLLENGRAASVLKPGAVIDKSNDHSWNGRETDEDVERALREVS